MATVTHTEPFHVSKAIATLDHVSHGRAGWQPRVSVTTHEAALVARIPERAADERQQCRETVVSAEFVDTRAADRSLEADDCVRDGDEQQVTVAEQRIVQRAPGEAHGLQINAQDALASRCSPAELDVPYR